MRTTHISLLGAIALAGLTACTVKDVDTPSLAGPSTFVHSITMVADRDTLTQNGVDFADIRVTAVGPTGQPENIPLRAQILVDGVPQDFGTLSTKTPTTPTTIRYTAPPASAISTGPQNVTIEVTPFNNGDFRSEFARQVTLRLEPFGVILPTNPNLVANFTFVPASPLAGQSVTFDASTATNNSVPCALACTYLWNFGDGTTATGVVATHTFKTAGNFAVTLSVTDARGATATATKSVTVGAPTPPTVQFRMSPTPAPVNTPVFFNASESQPAAGRTIVSYSWDFGDGTTGTGVTTAHTYTGEGVFTVILEVKDDAGASARLQQPLTVGSGGGVTPTASLTVTPASGPSGTRAVFDASGSKPSTGATIVSYTFNYGDGSTLETVTNPVQSHVYTGAPGTLVASVEVRDSNGRTAVKTVTFTIN
jgi:PKD repeat protein